MNNSNFLLFFQRCFCDQNQHLHRYWYLLIYYLSWNGDDGSARVLRQIVLWCMCVHYWMWSAEGTKNLCSCLKTVYLVKYFQPISQDTAFSSSFLVRLCEILAVLPKLTADWLVSLSDMTRSLAITYCEVSGPVESRVQDLCESRGGHPGLQSLINLQFLWM